MDRDLLAAAIEAMKAERDTCPRHDANYGAQWVWDYYCQRHLEKYGEPFGPHVIPDWDRPAEPAGSAAPAAAPQASP
jgi:hypothetical protein